MIKVCFDLGIFEILVKAGCATTAEDVASKTGADPQLISK